MEREAPSKQPLVVDVDVDENLPSLMGPLMPKLLFANERTFLHWMHACVMIASIAMAIIATATRAQPVMLWFGAVLSLCAVVLIAYAYRTFSWRASELAARRGERIDDPLGPMLLSGALLVRAARDPNRCPPPAAAQPVATQRGPDGSAAPRARRARARSHARRPLAGGHRCRPLPPAAGDVRSRTRSCLRRACSATCVRIL